MSSNLDLAGRRGVSYSRGGVRRTSCRRSGGLKSNEKKRCLMPTTKETATMKLKSIGLVAAGVIALGSLIPAAFADDQKLLNVSYDPTRELYRRRQRRPSRPEWQAETGQTRSRSSSLMAARASRRAP